MNEVMDKIIAENTICPYHMMEDEELHRKFVDHPACEAHGHCLYPIECTLFRTCLLNKKKTEWSGLCWSIARNVGKYD